jgi:sec-independent protein translocase protein TatA
VNLGPTELLIVLAIVLLLFGVGRVSRIGGELGSAVANFRKGVTSVNADAQTGDRDRVPPVEVS